MFKRLGGDKDRDNAEFTTINGIGLWSNWMRSFKQPFMALLDLLDNSIDATLHQPEFNAQVQIQVLSSANATGMIIANNACDPIKPLRDCLKIYDSAKEGNDSYIGENGVGLKQGCAALSDLSFIFCRREDLIEMGIIAKALQKTTGCWLPCFNLNVSVKEVLKATEEHRITLVMKDLDSISMQHEEVKICIEQAGKRSLAFLIVKQLFSSKWEQDYPKTTANDVFCIYLTELKHYDESIVDDIHDKLPQYYIHIDRINLQVNQKSISSTYWQRRLVEFTKFQVHVNKQTLLYEFPKGKGDDWVTCGYPLRVFLGFNPLRLGSLTLLIYSRKSGRLIKQIDDARHVLGLSHSGSDYCQGLTVIVDDYNGMLPLTPSKQDIAFSEESGGEAHEHNFFSWVGAVSKFYWNYHADRLTPDGTDRKSQLTKVIESHRPKVEKMVKASSMKFPSLQHADFNRFEEIPWVSRQKLLKSQKLTPIYTKNTCHAKSRYVLGNDTMLKLKAPEKTGKARSIKKSEGKVKRTPEKNTLKRESNSANEVPEPEEHDVKSVSLSSSSSYEPEARKRKRSLPARVSNKTRDDLSETETEQRMIRMISEEIESGSTTIDKCTMYNSDVLELKKELDKYQALWAEEKKRAAKYVSLWKNERRKLEESKAAYQRLKRSSGLVEQLNTLPCGKMSEGSWKNPELHITD